MIYSTWLMSSDFQPFSQAFLINFDWSAHTQRPCFSCFPQEGAVGPLRRALPTVEQFLSTCCQRTVDWNLSFLGPGGGSIYDSSKTWCLSILSFVLCVTDTAYPATVIGDSLKCLGASPFFFFKSEKNFFLFLSERSFFYLTLGKKVWLLTWVYSFTSMI